MTNEKLTGDVLHIRYIPISQAALWENNPKLHDLATIAASIQEHGFRDAPIFDGTLERIIAGNGRIEALMWMFKRGEKLPEGVALTEDGEWAVPVQFGVDAKSIEAAKSFAVDHNNITLLGGDLTLFDIAKIWEDAGYEEMLAELAELESLPISVDPDDVDALLNPVFLDELMPLDDTGAQESHTGYSFRVYVNSREDLLDAIQVIRELLDEHPEWQARIV